MNQEGKGKNLVAILLASFVALTDAIGVLLGLFGLDDFLILDIITWPVSVIYFTFNKGGGWYNLAANMLELIPYVGALPIRTAGFLMGLNSSKTKPPDAPESIKIKKPKGTIQSSVKQ